MSAKPVQPTSSTRLTSVKLPSGIRRIDSDVTLPQSATFETTPVDCGLEADEFIFSWNTVPSFPTTAGLTIEARGVYPDHTSTRYYRIADWCQDPITCPRQSLKGQKDADGDVYTDTLALKRPTRYVQIRVTQTAPPGVESLIQCSLKLLTICATSASTSARADIPEISAWGREILVPGRTQLGWPDAAGWCSPTSTDMVLAFWASRLKRPELDLPVPEVAHAIYDPVYDGTGNWPFNTAFAGAFPGIKAFVSRFDGVSEIETWIRAGLPVVVSVSYDLLKGKDLPQDAGHLMVCVGFTSDGDVVLNDPAHRPEQGEACRRVFTRKNFIRAWAHSRNAVYIICSEDAKLPADTGHHWNGPQPSRKKHR